MIIIFHGDVFLWMGSRNNSPALDDPVQLSTPLTKLLAPIPSIITFPHERVQYRRLCYSRCFYTTSGNSMKFSKRGQNDISHFKTTSSETECTTFSYQLQFKSKKVLSPQIPRTIFDLNPSGLIFSIIIQIILNCVASQAALCSRLKELHRSYDKFLYWSAK